MVVCCFFGCSAPLEGTIKINLFVDAGELSWREFYVEWSLFEGGEVRERPPVWVL